MVGYYDYVLGLIPLVFVATTAALLAVGTGLLAAVPVGATGSALLVGHALFVRAPTGPTDLPDAPARSGSGPSVGAD
jgi:hypothetical protein